MKFPDIKSQRAEEFVNSAKEQKSKRAKELITRRLAIFLVVATIFEFTNIGAAIFDTIGLNEFADNFRTPETYAAVANTVVFVSSSPGATQSWTVPRDWNSASNTVEVVGGGGGGRTGVATNRGGGGGGGGAYSKSSTIALTQSSTITIQVGGGGAANVSGTDTWFNGSTCAGASVCAKAGQASSTQTGGGLGGASASGVGTVKNSGGNGGNGTSTNTTSGGGGGGAAGSTGVGLNGQGSTASSTPVGGAGGNADSGGTGAGTGGARNGTGSNGTEWTSSYGSGGGGGGASTTSNGTGFAGGKYGAGGGGGRGTGAGAAGIQGLIVITYTPATPAGAPGTPTYASISTSTLTVNWTRATSSINYDLQRSTDGNTFVHIASATPEIYNDTGLSPNTTYYYKVAGSNSAGTGSYSASSSVQTTALSVTIGVTAGSMVISTNSGATSTYANVSGCTGSSTCAAFTMITGTGAYTLTSVKVTETGTVTSTNDLSHISLFYNSSTVGSSASTTILFGSSTAFTAESSTIAGSLVLATSTMYYFFVRFDLDGTSTYPVGGQTIKFQIATSTDVVFSGGAATSTGLPVSLNGSTTVLPNAVSFTDSGGLSDGGKSGDTITVSGFGFGTVATSSQTTCNGAINTGCIQIAVGGSVTVPTSSISQWSNTTTTFNMSSSLATVGGTSSLMIAAGNATNSKPFTFYVYPHVISMAVCTSCNANAAREYNASDTDGIIMLSGDHFAAATGTASFTGNFGNLNATFHNVAEGSCTTQGWLGSATSSNRACVEVTSSISDTVATGTVTLTRNADNKTDVILLTILPRIISESPTSSATGVVIDLKGSHFCESGVCPVSPNRSSTADNVQFGSTTAGDADFQNLTGGAGACNGTGVAWSSTEICVKVPSAASVGSASTTITSNTSYLSNIFSFTVISGTPNSPTNLNQYLSDAVTAISVGSSTTSTTEVFKGNLSAGTLIDMQLQVEVTSTANLTFACSGTGACSSAVSSAVYNETTSVTGASTTIPNFSSASDTGTGYHWQARAWNFSTGESSAWGSFGGNAESSADFTVDTNPPTIANLTSTSVSTSTATITWSTSAEAADSRVQYGTSTSPAIGSWMSATPRSSALTEHSAVANNGYIYSLGGTAGGNVASATVIYAAVNSDGSVGSWSTATQLPGGIFEHSSFANNGYIYTLGGFTGSVGTSTVFYAPINSTGSLGAWSTTTNLPTALWEQSSIFNNGYVYTIGGYAATQVTSTVFYAPVNSTGSLGAWSTTTALPSSTYLHASAVNNGYVYTFGGRDAADNPTSTVFYAPINSTGSLGAWSTTSNLPTTLVESAAVVNGGYVYLTGGIRLGVLTTTVLYAPINSSGTLGSWSSTSSMPAAVAYNASFVNNGYVYVVGGSDSNAATSTIYYAPLNVFADNCSTNNDCTSITDAVPPGTNSHSVNLTGLANSTLYYYRARSKDALGNESKSAASNFTTTSGGGAGLPATGQITSVVFDTGTSNGAAYNSILWEGTAGTGKAQFQLATSNSSSGPWNFYGSTDNGVTCDSSHWYSTTGPDAPAEISCAPQYHANQRFYKYQIQICSNNDCSTVGTTSPIVSSTVVNWSP